MFRWLRVWWARKRYPGDGARYMKAMQGKPGLGDTLTVEDIRAAKVFIDRNNCGPIS